MAWTSPVTSRLLLEANAQLGPYFWWGSRQKNAYDTTMIPVQENGGAYPGHQLPGGQLVRAHRIHQHRPGSASYMTGSHSAKFGFRYHNNDSTFPNNYYNNSQLKYNFQDGVPNQVTVYADANSHQEQQQSMFALYAQDRWTLGRLSLQGGLRFEHLGDYFPQQQMGPNIFLPTAVDVPGAGRPAQPEGPDAAVRRVLRRVRQREDGGEVLHGPVRDDVQHRRRVGELQPGRARAFRHARTRRGWTDANNDYVVDCNC